MNFLLISLYREKRVGANESKIRAVLRRLGNTSFVFGMFSD